MFNLSYALTSLLGIKLKSFFYEAEISYCYALHVYYILIEYHCFILTSLSQKFIFLILKWEWNCAFTWRVKKL